MRAGPFSLNILVGLALFASVGSAQSRTTAGRDAGIDAFGAVSDTNTAFYGTDRHFGGMVGADFSLFRYIPNYHGRLTTSIEARGTMAPGTLVSEKTVQGGVKVAYHYRQLHPYAALMAGGGSITFTPPAPLEPGYVYSSDSSFLFLYGGGVTVDVLRDWSLLADYQHQSWNLGFTPPITFTPQAVSLGVVYHVHFRPYRTR